MCDKEGTDEEAKDDDEGKKVDNITKEFKDSQRFTNPKSRFNAVFKCASKIKDCPNCKRKNHQYKKGALSIDYEIKDLHELEQ
jgi:hypothetical protein